MGNDAFDDLRVEYGDEALRRQHLAADPLAQFRSWLQAAVDAGVREPNAMALATSDADGQPHCRIVLLRQLDDHGFGFFTNKHSDKGLQLQGNRRAAATFWWHEPRSRQVRIEGPVAELPEADSDAYFGKRPRLAQVCSAASPQSRIVGSRDELERIVAELAERAGDGPVQRPAHWGGYALRPERIEFWQGRNARLHDRLRYVRSERGWTIERLAP